MPDAGKEVLAAPTAPPQQLEQIQKRLRKLRLPSEPGKAPGAGK